MTCDACERHVASALERAGAEDVSSDFGGGAARFDWPGGVAADDLRAAVADAGYELGALRVEEPAVPGPVSRPDDDYDLLVLGAGSAAFAAAIKGPTPATGSPW